MKKILFILYLCLLASVTACSQNLNESDFVEIAQKSGRFFESNFLSNIRYANEFQNIRKDRKGIVPFQSGYHLYSGIRFGHNITKNIHLIGEFGFSYFTEEAVCFCHDCDKTISSFTFLRLGSSHIGLGAR